MHQEYLNALGDKVASDAHILAAWLECQVLTEKASEKHIKRSGTMPRVKRKKNEISRFLRTR